MKHLIIRNIGPLKEADIQLDRLNVIIGTQSSGKSCILKLACYCSWVEKRIMLTRFSDAIFPTKDFINGFVKYYRMGGFIQEDSFISYETDYLKFSYYRNEFSCTLKDVCNEYKRPAISYIPSDRNIVSVFPEYQNLNISNHLQDYISEWNKARNLFGDADILRLGLKYHYDSRQNRDIVTNGDGSEIDLFSTSSGVQSMLPLYVLIDYLMDKLYEDYNVCLQNLSISREQEVAKMIEFLYRSIESVQDLRSLSHSISLRLNSKNLDYSFSSDSNRKLFENIVAGLYHYNHTELFIEEPENNIFPPTQASLMYWLDSKLSNSNRNDELFVATHSPYVLTNLLEKERNDFKFFFTYSKGNDHYVKTASEQDIQDIYEYGVDMFFNFEAFV